MNGARIAIGMVLAGLAAGIGVARAETEPPRLLSAEAIRAEITGRKLTGYYADGLPWTETYFPDTGISYQDRQFDWTGTWSFRGPAFCTFYNHGGNGGCWLVSKISPNCYEFFIAGPESWGEVPRGLPSYAPRSWTARGWRTEAASTCEEWAGS